MGRRGPAPTPTKLKVLRGEKPRNGEPVPAERDVKCPSWLPRQGRVLWRELAPDLERKGVLTHWDRQTFAAACWWWAKWREAQKLLDDEGLIVEGYRGSAVKHPAAQVARDAWQQFERLAARFGLTPSDRAQLHIEPSTRMDGEEYRDPARLLS